MTVGYCSSCRHFRYWAAERPIVGLARFGRCLLLIVPIAQMCHRYAPKEAP